MLQRWKESLKTKSSTRAVLKLIDEIEDISKQMVLEKPKDPTVVSVETSVGTKCIVPEDVKTYLFRLAFSFHFKLQFNILKWLIL